MTAVHEGSAPSRRHRLGFAVKVLGEGGLPSHDTRRWQSGPHLSVSLERLEAILAYCGRNEIRMYRLPSALAPYASHPELIGFHGQVEECAADLERVGELARSLDVRLSMHPGQYTVLNSESEDVVRSALAELEVQASILDAMNQPEEAVVVLHVGGAAGGPEAGATRFERGWERLSEGARRRVVIENDDRSYGIAAVADLARRCGARVVWDILHHRCHDPEGIEDSEALALAIASWPDGQVPKIHYSSPRLDVEERKRRRGRRVERYAAMPQLRAHADLIDPIGFEYFIRSVGCERDFDVMLEAKAKDLALLRLREQLLGRGFGSEAGYLSGPGS